MSTPSSSTTFLELGLAPALLKVLEHLKFTQPTPIQQQAIPIALQGKDLVGIAQTGTGKTLAFGLPMIQRLAENKGRGLIVLPTRELALQVDESLHKVGHSIGLRTVVLIGGTGAGPQIKALARDPHIIIATPGRLNDLLQRGVARLARINMVVLDEADRMLDMGFAPQIKRIINQLPANRQTMLFSATMPPEITKLATSHMKLPIRVEVAPAGTTVTNVTQEIFIVQREHKLRLAEKLLRQYSGSTLIFTRTKHGARKLTKIVREIGHSAAELHSNRSLSQRREALAGFKSGKYRVLIATDIASRGIDVTGIELVMNFDLPANAEDYVHRIGRTARAGAGGHAISLVTPDQRRDLQDIERLVRKTLPISKMPDLPQAEFVDTPRGSQSGGYRPYRQSSGRPRRSFGNSRFGGQRRFQRGR